MLAAHGERLARRPAGDKVNAVKRAVLEILDVAFGHIRPMADRIDLIQFVVPDGVARMRIPLDHRAVTHVVAGEAKRQASRAGEQLDRFERARRQHWVVFVKRGGEGLLVHCVLNTIGLNLCGSNQT